MTRFKKPKARRIVGGVDTHHAAVVLMNGRRVADREFPATRVGCADLLEWMRSFGQLQAVGVEGTGSYGAALARHLSSAKVKVVEVNRPAGSSAGPRASLIHWIPTLRPRLSWPIGLGPSRRAETGWPSRSVCCIWSAPAR
ncbi:IS110 family transposase [Nonomuraea sp. KC401]|uniref:IS110 family transposase n=1 Tax=unclassified Nonomuraea TaxID=2593643 RepID=UPI0010FF422C|nr:transposase [Nonomuraea sp. K271]TLF55628.1 IS110 family transposase [Nonomuraea sp. KC401]